MQRKEEILAKKAKLAELRRQREEREQRQKQGRRESLLDDGSTLRSPTPQRSTDRQDLDSFIDNLVGERGASRGPGSGTASPAGKKSRPSSTLGSVQVGTETYEQAQGISGPATYVTSSTQTDTSGGGKAVEIPLEQPQQSKVEYVTYSKAVQTAEEWSPHGRRRSRDSRADSGIEASPSRSPKASKRLSRRQKEKDEELRQDLRKEIEEELKASKDLSLDGQSPAAPSKFPARSLTNDELNAVTSSDDFLDFVERSSKVIEKALDQDYDVLADYALNGVEELDEDEDEGYASSRGKKGRRIKQTVQFWDERWSQKRMISDLGFSPKVPILTRLSIRIMLISCSFQSSSLLPTRRMHQRLTILQVWCKFGICTCTPGPNTPFTAPRTFSPPNSPPFILHSSLVAHTAAKSFSGIRDQDRHFQCKRHP